MKYSVAIVDDHTLLSQAISGLVGQFMDFNPIYTCKNGQELLDRLKDDEEHPDIVLMDINMPVMNGVETTRCLTKHYPKIKVVALTIEENEETILGMLRAGAKGYFMKDIEPDILENALGEVMDKGYYHSNEISELLIGSLMKDPEEACLKDREIEFIKLACSDKNYKEIANNMYVSPKTVDGYRDAVYTKLKLRNRIGLVLYAIRNGIFIP